MATARSSAPTDRERTEALAAEDACWRLSDGVLFSVFSSLLLWSLIVAGLHATLT